MVGPGARKPTVGEVIEATVQLFSHCFISPLSFAIENKGREVATNSDRQ